MNPTTVLPVEPEPPRHGRAVDGRCVAIGIDAVRVDENTGDVDVACRELVAHGAADNDDKIRTPDVQQLDALSEVLVVEGAAPVTAHPDFRPVVFEHERDAKPARQLESGIIVQAVALIHERNRAAPRGLAVLDPIEHVVQRQRRQLGEIPERLRHSHDVHLDIIAHGRDRRSGQQDGRATGVASSFSTPAMWPTDPPARTPKLRSVRRYSTGAERLQRTEGRDSLAIASTSSRIRRSSPGRAGSIADQITRPQRRAVRMSSGRSRPSESTM